MRLSITAAAASGRSSWKEFVEFGIRYDAGETVELAVLCNLARRLDEGVHCDARKRAADADAAYADVPRSSTVKPNAPLLRN